MRLIRFFYRVLRYCLGVVLILFLVLAAIVFNNEIKYFVPLDFRIDSIKMVHIDIDDSLFSDTYCYLLDLDVSVLHREHRFEFLAIRPAPMECADSIVDITIYPELSSDNAISCENTLNPVLNSISNVIIYDAESNDNTLISCDKYSNLDDVKYTIQTGIHRNLLHDMRVTDEGFCLMCIDKRQPRPNHILLNMKDTYLRGEVVNADKPKKYKLYKINY